MYTKIIDGHRECISCRATKAVSCFYQYLYITKQGKQSVRSESRCIDCSKARRIARYNDPVQGPIDKASTKMWREKNREHLAVYQKSKQSDPAYKAMKATAQRRRKAKIRASTNKEDCDEIKSIYAEAMRIQIETGIAYHVDHIHPLKLGGKHIPSNLQILTATENLKKGARLIPPCHDKETL